MKSYYFFAFVLVFGLSQVCFGMESSADSAAAGCSEGVASSSDEVDEAALADFSAALASLKVLCTGLHDDVADQSGLLGKLETKISAAQARLTGKHARRVYTREELLSLRSATLFDERDRLTALIQKSNLAFEDMRVWEYYWDKLLEFNRIRITTREEFSSEKIESIKSYIGILMQLAETAAIADFDAGKIYGLVVAERIVKTLSAPLSVDILREK